MQRPRRRRRRGRRAADGRARRPSTSSSKAFDAAQDARELTTLVAKVEAVGPAAFVTDLGLLENRFQFQRYLQGRYDECMSELALLPLVAELAAGRVAVVDLTQPLGPETPVIGLPPIFAASPGVSIDVISRYDDKGPAWYWNTIRMGEHTGTHFDAPVHWITRPGSAEQHHRHDSGAAVRRPGLRDRRHERGGRERGLPARRRRARAMGIAPRPDSARRVGAAAHGLEPAVG